MGRKRRIGLLGGSFNPAHAGHRHISLEAMKRLKLDAIWWLVSPHNPLKQASDLAEYGVRFRTAQALGHHPRIRVLGIEQRLGLRYSIDTIGYLKAHHHDCQFVWLMGADNLAGFHRWKAWRRIAALVPIAVLDRAPYGMKALHQRFATAYAASRQKTNAAHRLDESPTPRWVYLTIPRHPMSATALRNSLGKNAYLRHTVRD